MPIADGTDGDDQPRSSARGILGLTHALLRGLSGGTASGTGGQVSRWNSLHPTVYIAI